MCSLRGRAAWTCIFFRFSLSEARRRPRRSSSRLSHGGGGRCFSGRWLGVEKKNIYTSRVNTTLREGRGRAEGGAAAVDGRGGRESGLWVSFGCVFCKQLDEARVGALALRAQLWLDAWTDANCWSEGVVLLIIKKGRRRFLTSSALQLGHTHN